MGIRAWWNDVDRRLRFNRRQDRASDAKFYTLALGAVAIGIAIAGDWVGLWTFFES